MLDHSETVSKVITTHPKGGLNVWTPAVVEMFRSIPQRINQLTAIITEPFHQHVLKKWCRWIYITHTDITLENTRRPSYKVHMPHSMKNVQFIHRKQSLKWSSNMPKNSSRPQCSVSCAAQNVRFIRWHWHMSACDRAATWHLFTWICTAANLFFFNSCTHLRTAAEYFHLMLWSAMLQQFYKGEYSRHLLIHWQPSHWIYNLMHLPCNS